MINKDRSPLFLAITFLTIFISFIGLLAIYNASVIEGFNTFNDRFYFVKQQFNWLVLGLAIYFLISRFDPSIYRRLALPLFCLSLVLMLMVLIPGIGLKLQGARRWLSFGPIRFQPSELLKINLVLYLSLWFETKRNIKSFIAFVAFCLSLVMFQSDLGTSAIIASICLGMYYLSGASIKDVAIVIFSLVLGVTLLTLISPYRMQRLRTFVDPSLDTLGRSYHINQIVLGLGSGGMFGVGLGRSRQKYAYLPEATTDSIFAIIGEETGFIGGIFIIILLLSLCLLAFKVAGLTKNPHQRLIAAGIGLLFSAQTFVNLSSIVALIPLTGVPLPLISYGGSALITNFISLGILAGIARNL